MKELDECFLDTLTVAFWDRELVAEFVRDVLNEELPVRDSEESLVAEFKMLVDCDTVELPLGVAVKLRGGVGVRGGRYRQMQCEDFANT